MSSVSLAPDAQLSAFREARRRFVTAPQGPLALVNTEWITGAPNDGQTAFGVPGVWFPLEKGESGLRLRAAASDGIVVDGVLVDGEVVVRGADESRASTVRFSDTVTGTVIASEDGEYALRVWDSASEANAAFGRVDAFEFDPSWVIEASFRPIEGGSTIGIAHLKDGGATRERVVPAEITFSRDGVSYSLAAFQDDGGLLLVFSDATSGDSTYGVGRFLRVAAPAAGATPATLAAPDARAGALAAPATSAALDAGAGTPAALAAGAGTLAPLATPAAVDAPAAGTVTLDFNRAYLPPCAFSYHFNCPMPPAQNRLTVPITAGEKNVLARDGSLLHG
ncbi:DUF1684 domain-containing protein [Subtercola endophyticus]|uniref:DUF1684 domain-containing protein n=1 Tax=Subtercola endophyticus TaxID=2895559 RepID=UPI001E41686D|nr:DUF1684 domain-containing protein [Subtercola endophyticus]UFS57954.1 DUF1684 domain-containing protein [Subtercola endophyticus]